MLELFDAATYGAYMIYLMIAIGAITGATTRYEVSRYFNPIILSFPLGTLIVNLLGSFLMGLFIGFSHESITIPREVRLGFTTGFLGSLTTLSAFSIETVDQIVQGNYGWSALIILAQIGGALIATGIGLFTAKSFC